MKRLMYTLMTACFSVLVFAAAIGVHPMCAGIFLYQPEVPACLKK